MMSSASVGLSPVSHIAANTSFAILFEIVPSAMRCNSNASCSGVHRCCGYVDARVDGSASSDTLAHQPVGSGLRLLLAGFRDDRFEIIGHRLRSRQHRASYSGKP